MRTLIIFLIRKKLGLKKFEDFRFVGQKTEAVYYFTESSIMKKTKNGLILLSDVSLNWLLHDDCQVVPVLNPRTMKGLITDGNTPV